ncbi:hypothetical protein KEM60_00753 [Austwickia sp. TVS 96-490-7B]|uniref:hypothetical protein n=1 Tax=Austwickia sp. TVS 96-490-7B TaxID=2830843 RepID=UPI001C563B5B|nr:hypothetical protein [Austwickia sp. TVS 96-490-7B]MBW3084565.1 hypothetical protein [Austwickia sp. TVS 96-490-7B]
MPYRMSCRRVSVLAVLVLCPFPVATAHSLPTAASPCPAAAPSCSEVIHGRDLAYRVVPLPEPALPPSHSFGSDVSESGTLLVSTKLVTPVPPEGEPPPPDGSTVYLADPGHGVTSLPIETTDCYAGATLSSWKGLSFSADGSIVGTSDCTNGESVAAIRDQVVAWPTPTSMPRVLFYTSPKFMSHENVVANSRGQVMHVDLQQFTYPYATQVRVDETTSREIGGPDAAVDVYGTDLADDGTVVGVSWERDPAMLRWPHQNAVQKPFVTDRDGTALRELKLPTGMTPPAVTKPPATVKVSPDGRWILGAFGSTTVAWDGARRPRLLSTTAGIAPVELLKNNRALVNSVWGPAILASRVVHPITVKGLPEGARLESVAHINSAKCIAATLLLADGRHHAALLEPIDRLPER